MSEISGTWWADDDTLLAAVKQALHDADDVPASFVATGKGSYAWHNIDAELAALTYDSALDELAGATTRAEPAVLRSLTFDARDLTIEVEIIADALHGQLVPPQSGDVELRQADGRVTRTTMNDVGYFTVSPLPSGTFRIHCRDESGRAVLTDWVTL